MHPFPGTVRRIDLIASEKYMALCLEVKGQARAETASTNAYCKNCKVMNCKKTFLILSISALTVISFAADSSALLKNCDDLDRLGKNREALAVALEMEKVAPYHAAVLRRVAKQYAELVLEGSDSAQKKADSERSIAYAKRAVAADPNDALAHLTLAICYGRAATISDSKAKIAYSKLIKEHAEKSLTLDPKNDLTYFVLGSWSYEIANMNGLLRALARMVYGTIPSATNAEAVRYLEKAIAINPNRVASQAELGRAYAAVGNRNRARENLNRALSLPNADKSDDAMKMQARRDLNKL